MIYQLLATLLLSASVCSAPVHHNAVYNDNDLTITLSADDLNNGVYSNLASIINSEEIVQSAITSVSYSEINCSIEMWDVNQVIVLSCDVDFIYFSLYEGADEIYPHYTFVYEDEMGDTHPFDYDLNIAVVEMFYFDVKNAIMSDLDGGSPEPEPQPQPSNLYQIIYDFFYGIFNNETLSSMTWTIGGQSVDLNAWICHSLTIILLITLLIILLLITRWAFRVFAGLIK